jgi:hypothetical protein
MKKLGGLAKRVDEINPKLEEAVRAHRFRCF